MSWLSDLAGKAENFLNNLDNSAAQALNKSQENLDQRQHYNRKTEPTIIKDYDKLNRHSSDNFNSADSIKSLPLKLSINKNTTDASDQNLFQFNYNSDMKRSRSDVFSNTNLETSSDKCSSGYRTVNEDYFEKSDELVNVSHNVELDSNPAIENKLLRSEISSLNQEISSLLQRNHKTEEEIKRLRNQLEKTTGQLRESDRKFRQIASDKDDLVESMKVKDQKLAVLQAEIQSNALKKQDSYVNGDANVISDHRNKIVLLEQELRTKNEAMEKLEGEKLHWQNNLDDAKLKLAQTINNYEKTRLDDKRRIDLLTEQCDLAKQKAASIQNDLKEYKVKAANILQMKEKIITSLKGCTDDDKFSPTSSTDDTQQELANLRHDCDLMREEVARCRLELEHKDFDLQELDHQMHTETESLRKNLDLLEEQLDRERQLREDVDADYRQLTRENRHLQEKYMREKADFHDHLASKDEEIARMRQMISTKHANQTDQVIELESRVQSLTDTLIQKQAALDANKADYHSLQIRLERTEIELANLQKPSVSSNINNMDRRGLIGMGGSDFISINMQDAPVTKNVKTALNSLDKLSLRMGLFMRRYPPARLFFFFYTIVLHFWVLFVFFTYQPEMHTAGALNNGGL